MNFAGRSKVGVVDWVVAWVTLLFGSLILGIVTYSSMFGTTAEHDLFEVEGVPDRVSIGQVTDGWYLKFAVRGLVTEYAHDRPQAVRVRQAVQSGEPIRIGVSTRQEGVWPRDGWVSLYMVSAGGQSLLTYAETVAHQQQRRWSIFWFGLVVTGLGLGGVIWCFWKRGQFQHESMNWRFWKAIVVTTLLSAFCYGTVLHTVLFEEKGREKAVQAFGAHPCGLSLEVAVVTTFTLIYLPFPFVFWHMVMSVFHDADRGLSTWDPAECRFSKRVCWAGLAYFLFWAFAWIVYAGSLGI